jgi:hypothetical protein
VALKLIRTALLAGVLTAIASAPVMAQSSNGGQNWFVSLSGWGKWISLATAAGLTTVGAISSSDASDRFTILETACRTDSFFCRTNSDGNSYVDPEAERLFQATLTKDSQAQNFLIGGQLTLIVSATMFLADLLNGDGGPENIPFTPLKVFSTPGRAGLRLDF